MRDVQETAKATNDTRRSWVVTTPTHMSSTSILGRMVQKSTFQTAWSSHTFDAMRIAPSRTRFQFDACNVRLV